jgi:hypothetical protein
VDVAEGDVVLYNNFKEQLLLGAHNLDTATIKVALVTGYTPDRDAHDYWDDVVANEESGAGYTAGGATLANTTVAQDNTNDRATLDADDVTYTGLDGGTPGYAIMYVSTGTNSTSTLIGYWELGRASNGGNYTLAWSTSPSAILTLT